MSKENPIHHQDQALIERIHARHLERIGALGDEAIQFQDASYAVGRQRGAQEANGALLSVTQRLVQWDLDYPVNCHNGYAGLEALNKIIADAKAAIAQATQPLNPA